MKYPDTAYGGVLAMPAGARPAAHGTSGQLLSIGGEAWEGAPPICEFKMKDTGWPCDHEALEGRNHCLGHARVAAREAAKNKDS